jgi:DNA-binding transcriptional regulator YiaG
LDGNKSNNCLENLEWTTHSRNLQHAFQTDLHPGKSLQAAQVKSIRASLDAGLSASAIATVYGVSTSAIRHIQSRRSWAWLD